MKNLVLYRVREDSTGAVHRQALLSVNPEEPLALLQIQTRAAAAFLEQGYPGSFLQAVQEEREADEQGRQTKAEFCSVDIVSGAVSKPVADIAKLLPKKKGA